MVRKRTFAAAFAFAIALLAWARPASADTLPGENCSDSNVYEECVFNCGDAEEQCQDFEHPTLEGQTCYAHLTCPVSTCIIGPFTRYTCTFTVSS